MGIFRQPVKSKMREEANFGFLKKHGKIKKGRNKFIC